MSSEELETIFRKLVESYSNSYPSNPLQMLNMHIEAYVRHEWEAKEPAILDLALKKGIEIPKIEGLRERGKSRKEAILEVAKDMKFQVSDTEAEHWVRELEKERPREVTKKYEEQRMIREIKEQEKGIERLTTLFSKGEISEESYKRAVKTIEGNIEDLRSGKAVSVIERGAMEERKSSYYHVSTKPSRLWYLVPLFFSLLGGIIAYIGVKDEDRDMANTLIIVGVFVFLVEVIILWFQLVELSRFY